MANTMIILGRLSDSLIKQIHDFESENLCFLDGVLHFRNAMDGNIYSIYGKLVFQKCQG